MLNFVCRLCALTWLALCLNVCVLPSADAARGGQSARGAQGAAKQSSVAARQSHRHGGHLGSRHLAKSNTYLANRTKGMVTKASFNAHAAGATMRTQFNSAARGKPVKLNRRARQHAKQLVRLRLRGAQASTFRSGRAMDAMWKQAQRRNRAKLRTFLRDPNAKTLVLDFASRSPVGVIYNSRSGQLTGAGRGRFIVRKGGGGGFYPHTGYLTGR